MITKHDLEYVGHECMADYYEAQLKKVSKRQPIPTRKTIVKLFWGLITYEK
jgi:hypothetical protein